MRASTEASDNDKNAPRNPQQSDALDVNSRLLARPGYGIGKHVKPNREMLLDFRPRRPRRFRALKIFQDENRVAKAREQRRILFYRRLRATQSVHHDDRRMLPGAVRQKLLNGDLLITTKE